MFPPYPLFLLVLRILSFTHKTVFAFSFLCKSIASIGTHYVASVTANVLSAALVGLSLFDLKRHFLPGTALFQNFLRPHRTAGKIEWSLSARAVGPTFLVRFLQALLVLTMCETFLAPLLTVLMLSCMSNKRTVLSVLGNDILPKPPPLSFSHHRTSFLSLLLKDSHGFPFLANPPPSPPSPLDLFGSWRFPLSRRLVLGAQKDASSPIIKCVTPPPLVGSFPLPKLTDGLTPSKLIV